jgi:hypothetical protein
MTTSHALADKPRQTLAEWHRFVETSDPAILPPLIAPNIIFRSPFVYAPIPGTQPALLILGAVAQVFENFRYHREFVASPHDVALEFSASIGKWELKGVDLITFDEAGKMIEFEVMVRPFKALEALNEALGARIGPQLAKIKQAAASGG